MARKFETVAEFTECLKRLRDDINEFIGLRVDLDEIFRTPEFKKGDKQAAIEFVRRMSANMPTYMEQRRGFAEEYLAQRDDVDDDMKSLMLSGINMGTDLSWYITLQQILRDVGVSEEEVDSLRVEYSELPKTL